MNKNFVILQEKIEWLKTFIDMHYTGLQQSSDIHLKMTQLPRKSRWQDPYIFAILEITDNQRTIYEEAKELTSMTIIEDINTLHENVKNDLSRVNVEKEVVEKELLQRKIDLKTSKSNYKEAMQNKSKDIWLCTFELKACLKKYLLEKDKVSVDCKLKTYEQAKLLKDYEEQYNKIFKNYVRIQNGFITKLSESISYRNIDDIEDKNIKETHLDFDNNEDEDVNDGADNLEKVFYEVISELQSEVTGNTNVVPHDRILKCGVYKIKRAQRSGLKPYILIYTENNFLHAFDLDLILQKNANIKIKYQEIFAKIKQFDANKFTFFFENKKKSLNFKEESEVLNMLDDILKDINFVTCKNDFLSFSMANKNIKLDKDKYEIAITDKNTSGLAKFFAPNVIKIKSYILKDLFEMYFKITTYHKIQNATKTTEPNRTEHDQTDTCDNIGVDDENTPKTISWNTIKDENPWYC